MAELNNLRTYRRANRARPSKRFKPSSRDTAPRRCPIPIHRAVAGVVVHPVICPWCQQSFDLFTAAWCEHQESQPSKLCPACGSCLCAHPAYAEPHFWKEAPRAFRERGFDRLFLFYL